jgi:hypothetical protein
MEGDSGNSRIFDPMPKAKHIIVKKRIIEWLMNITLVLALISVSGNASSVKTHHNEATRTEFKISNKLKSKRTVSYKTFVCGLKGSSFQNFYLTRQFIHALLQYEIIVKLKYQSTLKALVFPKKPDLLPVVYFSDQTGFDLNTPRG